MGINIQNNHLYQYSGLTSQASRSIKSKQPSFSGAGNIQRLTHMNIGMMPQGFIGHVSLQNVTKGTEEFVKVFKNFDCGNERYFLKR